MANKNDDIFLNFGKQFTDVTKKLQKKSIWDHNNLQNKEEFNNLFSETLEKLHVIFGYYIEYDPLEKRVIYFNDHTKNSNLPKFPNSLNSEGIHELINKYPTTFLSLQESPKFFQHLPIQSLDENEQKRIISEKCINCAIQCEIRKGNDYYVVLFEEIAFFQFAYCFLKKENISDYYNLGETDFLLYTIKFALGLEKKLNSNFLCKCIFKNENKSWIDNSIKKENKRRKELKNIVEKLNKDEQTNIIKIINNLVCIYIKDLKDKEHIKNIENDIDILKLVSRFDIETSFLIEYEYEDKKTKFHDLFVFPIYTHRKNPILKTKCVIGEDIEIYSPLLVALYVKTINKINVKQFDENKNSIKGFQLTKEIIKAFSEGIIQDDYLSKIILKELYPSALRAAISQVMARNGSHNIGSHVLNQLVRGLKDIDFNNQNYINSIFSLNDHHKDLINCFDSEKPIPKCNDLAFAQLEYFNGYIKNRMEYLGDLAMNTPKMSSSLYLISDIFKDFDKVRLLLNTISGLGANFIYEIQFIIKGEKITKYNYKDFDIKLAIANDITGCQAFYNIFENIIRNTAKHSIRNNKDVIFTIDVKDIDADYYQINIYDDVEKDGIDDKVKNQNTILNKNVLDEVSNSLRQGSLGMIEMDASAAYLRMLDITMINDNDYEIDLTPDENNKYNTKGRELPILNANKFPLKEGDEAKCLGYQFYMPKPKEFLFIKETGTVIDYEKLVTLKNEGVDVIFFDDFKNALENDTTFPHQFVIKEMDFCAEVTSRKAQYSPRVLKFQSCLINETFVNIERKIWELWTEKKLGSNEYYKICTDAPDQNEKNNIVFSDHGLNESVLLKQKYVTIEALSSLAQNKLPLFNQYLTRVNSYNKPIKNYVSNINDYKIGIEYLSDVLGDAATNKILVIDERIQEYSQKMLEYNGDEENKLNNEIPYYKLYEAMNVFIPSLTSETSKVFEYNLSNEFLDKKLIKKIKDYINVENPDFLVIHYGILERVFGDKKDEDINNFLKKLFNKNKKLEIIITSGRTRISGLPKFVRFVNLAPLLSAFIEIRSKYSINKILNDSRI